MRTHIHTYIQATFQQQVCLLRGLLVGSYVCSFYMVSPQHTYTHIHLHTYTRRCLSTGKPIQMSATVKSQVAVSPEHTYTHIHIPIGIHAYIHSSRSIIRTYIYPHTHTHIHTHIHTYTRRCLSTGKPIRTSATAKSQVAVSPNSGGEQTDARSNSDEDAFIDASLFRTLARSYEVCVCECVCMYMPGEVVMRTPLLMRVCSEHLHGPMRCVCVCECVCMYMPGEVVMRTPLLMRVCSEHLHGPMRYMYICVLGTYISVCMCVCMCVYIYAFIDASLFRTLARSYEVCACV